MIDDDTQRTTLVQNVASSEQELADWETAKADAERVHDSSSDEGEILSAVAKIILADQRLPVYETSVVDARQALVDYDDNAFLDSIASAVSPLAEANVDNLAALRGPLTDLLEGAQAHDGTVRAKALGANASLSSRVSRGDAPIIDGELRLAPTSRNVATELCALLEPIFRGLGSGGIAADLRSAVVGGSPLPANHGLSE